MKNTELIIGCYVGIHDGLTSKPFPALDESLKFTTVIEIGEKKILIQDHLSGIPYTRRFNSLYPIVLNTELMFRLGFHIAEMEGNVVDGARYWVKNGLCLYEFNGKFQIKIGEQMRSGDQVIRFDKVHELQKIYSLTGGKLEFL